jgi:hypothetical protein
MPKAPDTIACELAGNGNSHGNKQSFRRLSALCRIALVALPLAGAAPAFAQDAVPPAVMPPTATPPTMLPSDRPPLDTPGNPLRLVGGHIGLAIPIVSFHHLGKTTQTPSDQLTLAVPIGITVHMSPDWVVDFEEVVGNAASPAGATGLTIDPGVIYVGGPVALGLRIKWDVGTNVNVGLIPLIHKGIVDVGPANWFIEAAFPITYTRIGAATTFTGTGTNDYTLAVVLHTGIAF